MKKELIAGGVGTGLAVLGTATQLNEVLQTISLIITILGALVSFVVVPLLSWYRNAKKDGKVTKKEFKEGYEHLKEGLQRTKEWLDDYKGQTASEFKNVFDNEDIKGSQTADKDKREEIEKKGGSN